MAFTVRLTEHAERDLDEIYRYVAAHDSTERADHVLNELEAAASKLVELPERGNIPKELQSLGIAEYREVHWRPYRIIYRIDGDKATIYCIADGRRGMQSLLQRRLLS